MQGKDSSEKQDRSDLQKRLAEWTEEGYDVGRLREALEKQPEHAREEFDRTETGIEKLREVAAEMARLEVPENEPELARLRKLLTDPWSSAEAENTLMELQIRVEKRKKQGQERARLAEKVRRWKEEGFNVDIPQSKLDGEELFRLRQTIQQTEEAISRLRELRGELDNIKDPRHEAEREQLRAQLTDPARLHSTEDAITTLQVKDRRLRKEAERKLEEANKRRKDTQERIKEWKEAGYDTSKLEAAIASDDETLKKEMVMFRIQLRRLKELRAELLAIPPEGVEEEVVRLMEKTKTVSLEMITELEPAVAALKSKQEARQQQRLAEKEKEKNEKEQLVQKLTGWVEKGYRDGLDVRLEGVISKDLPAMREEIARMESKVRRMEVLRAELEALDTAGFEAERAAMLEMLPDIARIDEAWTRMLELKDKVEKRRAQEQKKAEEDRARREEARGRLEEYKRLGYDVSRLEKLLGGDLEVLRKELALAHINVQKAEQMRADLAGLRPEHFEKEASEILEDMPDLEKIALNEKRLEALRALVSEHESELRKRADLRKRMDEWRMQGYDTRRLEAALGKDIETVTKEFMMFKLLVQKLNDLHEELRSLDIAGFEEEASAIRAGLMNVEGVQESRARLSELELRIGKRISERVRVTEEKKKIKEDCMTRMSEWLSDGFHVDGLEEALMQEPGEMAARFARFEEGVYQARRMRQELDELAAPGFEELAAGIREELRDVSRLEQARKDMRDIWERIDRRAREAECRKAEDASLRQGLARQIAGWKEQGHIVGHLETLAGGKVEHLRKAVLDFRIQLERRKDLAGILAAIDTRGFEEEAARIRDMMKDVGGLDDASAALDGLKERIRHRREQEAREREQMHQIRDSCIDRFTELLADGYNIEGLENALELPVPELARERERVDSIVVRLKELEGEIRRSGLAEGEEAILSKLKDINALPQLKEWLAQKARTKRHPAAQAAAPQEPQERQAEPGHRREAYLDPDKIAALRLKLEELKGQGHDVSELEQYLDSGTITPEGTRMRLVALNRRLKGEPDIPEVVATPAPDRAPPAGMDIVVASMPASPAREGDAKPGGEAEGSGQKDAGGTGGAGNGGAGGNGDGNVEEGDNGRAGGGENGDMKGDSDEAGGPAGERPSVESVKKLKKVKKVAK